MKASVSFIKRRSGVWSSSWNQTPTDLPPVQRSKGDKEALTPPFNHAKKNGSVSLYFPAASCHHFKGVSRMVSQTRAPHALLSLGWFTGVAVALCFA